MFLTPLVNAPDVRWQLRCVRTSAILARQLETAFDSKARRRGLLDRLGLSDGAALIIAPCNGIHTFFMKFPIDLIFAARDGRVLKVSHAIPAWRVDFSWKAFAVIELPAETAGRTGIRSGDLLEVVR